MSASTWLKKHHGSVSDAALIYLIDYIPGYCKVFPLCEVLNIVFLPW